MSNFILPDQITYWKPAALNGTGGKTWAIPVVTPARIALVAEEVIDAAGKTVITSNAIYTRITLENGDYIAIGDSTNVPDPTVANSNAKKVIRVTSTSSMSDMARMLI